MSTPATPGAGTLRALVARATLAPSIRNAQPWRWTVLPDRIDLELDEGVARRLELNDPSGRELVMSCGAALFTLRVAAAEALFDARAEILPDPHRPGLLATVTVQPGAIDAAFADLDAVIALRHTVWSGFAGLALPPGLVARLQAEAEVEGACLHEVDRAGREDLARLLRHADAERYDDPRRRAEVASWISSRWSDEGRAVSSLAAAPARAAVRHFDLGEWIGDHDVLMLGDAPCVAVLATGTDSRADWIAAGQALQRVLLVAAREQVSGGFLNAACQVDGDRERMRALLPGHPYPQVVLRLGYPLSYPLGTPRRPVDEVVTVQDGPGGVTGGATGGATGRVPGVAVPSPGEAAALARDEGADFTEDTLG